MTKPENAVAADSGEELPPDAPVAGAAAAETAELAAELIAACAEAADLKDKLLRTLAEMENLRRRTEREVADARTYGIAAFARDVLVVADNMQRALAAVPGEAVAGDAALKALVDGVELTERELLKALEKQGVSRFDPAGEKFDPNRHQAMFEIADSAVANGTIVQVMQVGYVLGGRVLRPALVAVAKGGPKAAANGNGEGTNPDTAAGF